MAYKTYTLTHLVNFTGRTSSAFQQSYVETSAIPQAVLLFKLATCITDPDALTADERLLVDYAILAMADALQLEAKNRLAASTPFNSESLGSYSYSKTAQAIQRGDETGIMWFDQAVSSIGQCDSSDGDFQRGGIEVSESDGVFTSGYLSGNVRLVPTAEQDAGSYGFDPNSISEYGTTPYPLPE